MFQGFLKRIKSSPSFWQTMANYTERAWGFAYSLILARIILPEYFGVFAFGAGIAQLASILTRWEVGNLVRSDVYYQEEGFDSVWTLTKVLLVAEVFVIAAVATVCASLGMQQGVWITILVSGFANALDKLPVLLRSDLEGRSIFKHNLTVKILLPPAAALITIPLAMLGFGLWALLASAWLGVAINWFVFRRANRRVLSKGEFSLELLKKVIKPSFWQWINYICYIIFTRADKVAVGSAQSSQEVAYYNRSFNYAPLSFIGLGAIAGVPAIVAFRDLENPRKKWRIFAQRAGLLVIAGIVNGLLWIYWGDELVVLLFGENWRPAVPYFKVFAFFGSVQGLYYLAGAIMQGSKKYKQQGLITAAAIILAIISLLFLPFSGLIMAIVLQSAMVLAAIGMIIYLSRETRIKSNEL
jgi:O-antigen/teichoic acid export membrane protein